MTEIEFIVLANHVETKDGLLYLMGGGWTDHWRSGPPDGPPPISHYGVGVAINVPWDETNRRHPLIMRLETEDGTEVAGLGGEMELGRPAGLPPGSDQRWVLAVNFDMQFPKAGGYRIVAELAGQRKSVSFRVHDQRPPR